MDDYFSPPLYNFAIIPSVKTLDSFWEMKYPKGTSPLITAKSKGNSKIVAKYEDIKMPKNTPFGLFIAVCSFFIGFGIIWQIIWLAVLGVIGVIAFLI